MKWLNHLIYRGFVINDRLYRRIHRFIRVNPLLLVKVRIYQGPNRQFDDGTVLKPGDSIGELHFDNAFLSQQYNQHQQSYNFLFARHMRRALRRLAEACVEHPELQHCKVFHGVTWIAEHGAKVGFATEQISNPFKRWWLSTHFKWLVNACFVQLRDQTFDFTPRQFWLPARGLVYHHHKKAVMLHSDEKLLVAA